MKNMLIGLLAICFISSMPAYSAEINANQNENKLGVEVIKAQLELTKQSFKSLELVEHSDGQVAVIIRLTAEAAKLMHNLTVSNINNRINIVWHNHIITALVIKSPLNANFEITGFSKEEALTLVKEMQP